MAWNNSIVSGGSTCTAWGERHGWADSLKGSNSGGNRLFQFLELLEGKVNRVIGGIRQMATKRDLSPSKWNKVEDCLTYLAARSEYMKYDEYLAAGYPIGSGVVEGACRHLVKDRMEQASMRWRIAGAQAILSLRAIYVNDDWETFHADRIQAEQRKLYPYKKHLAYPKLRSLMRSRGCNPSV